MSVFTFPATVTLCWHCRQGIRQGTLCFCRVRQELKGDLFPEGYELGVVAVCRPCVDTIPASERLEGESDVWICMADCATTRAGEHMVVPSSEIHFGERLFGVTLVTAAQRLQLTRESLQALGRSSSLGGKSSSS